MKKTAQELITEIETLVTELKLTLSQGDGVMVARTAEKKLNGLTGQIYDLTKEGFFDQSKTLSDIQTKLRDEGINKPVTSLMKPLLYLVKEKFLKRERSEKGQYRYQIR